MALLVVCPCCGEPGTAETLLGLYAVVVHPGAVDPVDGRQWCDSACLLSDAEVRALADQIVPAEAC